MITCCPNLIRRLTVMMRGLTTHTAALRQTGKNEIYPKSRRAYSRTYAQAAQRATPRPLGFGFFIFICLRCGRVLVSASLRGSPKRAQRVLGASWRADLYKTSTRQGAKVVIFQKRECSCALPKILFIMLP